MRISGLLDWLTFADYFAAKDNATKNIVKKQTRGNVFSQKGWYMTTNMLEKISKQSDRAIQGLKNKLSKTA